MSYDDHSSTDDVARYYPLPQRDRIKIEMTTETISLHFRTPLGNEFHSEYTGAEIQKVIGDLIAARTAMLEAGEVGYARHVADGYCPATKDQTWCNRLADHDGPHWAKRIPNPTMPVDAIANPNRIEWT